MQIIRINSLAPDGAASATAPDLPPLADSVEATDEAPCTLGGFLVHF